MQDLGTLGGTFSAGVAINDSGQVTGCATTADGDTHAFLWDGTRMRDLGTFGGTTSAGTAINASGQVAGYADTADGESHAFLWDGTRMQDLGTLGGTYSDGVAINDSGQVAGPPIAAIPVTPSSGMARRCRTSARWGAASYGAGHQRLRAGDGLRRNGRGTLVVSLPVGRHEDAGPRPAGGLTDGSGVAINASGQVTGYALT